MIRCLLVVLLIAAGCGEKSGPVVSKNNKNNEVDEEDEGNISIFPDVTINNQPHDFGMPPVDLGSDLGTPDLGADLAAADAATDAAVDAAVDMAMNCPLTDVAAGDPCKCNQECQSGVCADATANSDGFCTSTCTARADCPSGQACVRDRFGESVCRADDTGTDCTDAANPAPELCSSGHCLQAGSNYSLDFFCSVPCSSSSECMMGHACTPVRCQFNPTDGYRCIPNVIALRLPNTPQVLATYPEATKLCVKVGDTNPCGTLTMSSDQQACPGSMCDSDPVGRCTSSCVTTADCPAGGCVDYDLSDPTLPVRVCDL